MEKVMFIDDDPMVLRMASFIMKKCCRQAVTASSGDEGILMIRNEIPEIIFIDAEMPEKNGFETLKEIKNDSETAAIPVCLMSGTVSDELKDKAILSGAIGLIEKPLQLPQLLSIIESVL